jgi:hypothetical protein
MSGTFSNGWRRRRGLALSILGAIAALIVLTTGLLRVDVKSCAPELPFEQVWAPAPEIHWSIDSGTSWPQGSREAAHLESAFDWLNAAEWVAQKTEDRHARQLVTFLNEKTIIGEPVISPDEHNDVKALWGARGPALLWIIPILEEDGGWESCGTTGLASARFLPQNSWIVLRLEPLSRIWKGISLLQAADRAQAYLAMRYNWQDPNVYSEKGRDTNEFQNRLMTKLGGRTYADALDRELARIRRTTKEKHLTVGEVYPGRAPYDLMLDEAFSPAKSDFERDERTTHLWIQAVFRWIDEDFPGTTAEKEERKALFLRSAYARDGMLPRQSI